MAGLFFKSLIRRTVAAVSKPKARRRAPGLRQSLEGLETRALLSAVGYDTPDIPAEIRVVNAETSAPPGASERARKTKATAFNGSWNIETPAGVVAITSQEHGVHIRGQADLSGIDLSKLNLPGVDLGPFQALLGATSLPNVKFTGTFENNQLDAHFHTKLSIPELGKFNILGEVTGTVDSGTSVVNGHLGVTVNGATALDQDFSSPLPLPAMSLNLDEIPRISGVAGTDQFNSNVLGNGTVTITQQGQDITGVFDAPNLTSGTFDAHFKTEKARQAKGTADFQFTDSQTPETDKFWISFFKDGELNRFRFR